MTKEQRAQKALDRWVGVLRLGHWDIEVVLEDGDFINVAMSDPDYGAVGRVDRHFASLTATVYVAGRRTGREIVDTIRHELLHVLVTELGCVAYDLAGTQGDEARALAKRQIDTAEEHVVRTLERAFEDGEGV